MENDLAFELEDAKRFFRKGGYRLIPDVLYILADDMKNEPSNQIHKVDRKPTVLENIFPAPRLVRLRKLFENEWNGPAIIRNLGDELYEEAIENHEYNVYKSIPSAWGNTLSNVISSYRKHYNS